MSRYDEPDHLFDRARRRESARLQAQAGPCPFAVGDRVRSADGYAVSPFTITRVELSVQGNWMLFGAHAMAVLAHMVVLDG